jgi:hypothetical protein
LRYLNAPFPGLEGEIRKSLPSAGDVHVNMPLTNVSVAMMQSADNFVADRMFSNVPVLKQSDRYYTYDRGDFNRDEMQLRAPGAESAGGGYRIDNTPNYFCDVWAFHKDIPLQVRANADAVLNLDMEATNYITLKGLIRKEKAFVANWFTSSVWTNDWSGAASSPGATQILQWNQSASTPIEDVRKFKRTILQSTGFLPNVLTLGRPVYDVLCDHPEFIDRIKYGQTAAAGPARTTRQIMAALFELDDILVMDAIENTAAEGQTNSHAFIGGKHLLLAYRPAAPGLMTPAAGYTFSWTGYMGAGPQGQRISQFYLPQFKSDRVEIELAFAQKQIAADLGFFVLNAVA